MPWRGRAESFSRRERTSRRRGDGVSADGCSTGQGRGIEEGIEDRGVDGVSGGGTSWIREASPRPRVERFTVHSHSQFCRTYQTIHSDFL
jgi:hypothetical protein